MNILETLGSLFKTKPSQDFQPNLNEAYEQRMASNARIFGGERNTVAISNEGAITRKGKYYKGRLTDSMCRRFSPKALIDLLNYNHPDFGQAVWNFKIMGNNGHKITVTKLDGSKHDSGQKLIDDFIRGLYYYSSGKYDKTRSITKIIDQMFDAALVRGAVSLEMVMDRNTEKVLHFAVVDPDTIRFEQHKGRLIPYQDKIKLDIPTFFHEGIDESDTDPYGTTPFLSAIKILIFHTEVLEDLKMVVHNQGYGKYDIKIVEEVLLKRMPINIRNNEAKKQQWLNERLGEIIDMYSKLDPDAAFVHFDSVEVGMVEAARAVIDPEKLMNVIDSQIQNALKQYSTFMGRRSTGQTEQYARMEARIFFKSVRRIQEPIENILSRALTRLLNINGMQGYVKFEFDGIDLRSEIEKVNFEQIAISNEATKRNQGWVDQDEAANTITGHDAVGEPDKEMLGVKKDEPQGAQDERTPSNPSSADSTSSGDK